MWSDDAAHGRGGYGDSTNYVYRYAAPASTEEWAQCAHDLIAYATQQNWTAEQTARQFVDSVLDASRTLLTPEAKARYVDMLKGFIAALNSPELVTHTDTAAISIMAEAQAAQEAARKAEAVKEAGVNLGTALTAMTEKYLKPNEIDQLPLGIKLAARLLNLENLEALQIRDPGRDAQLKSGLDAAQEAIASAVAAGVSPEQALKTVKDAVTNTLFYQNNAGNIVSAMLATGRTLG